MTAEGTPGGGAAASAIELLSSLPGLEREGIRQALLLTARLDSALLDVIPTGGTPLDFATAAVEASARHGDPADRRPGLVALLEASAAFGDAPYRARVREVVDDYLRELAAPGGRWRTFLQHLGLTADTAPVAPPADDFDRSDAHPAASAVLDRRHAAVLVGEPHADLVPAALGELWRAYRDEGLEPRWLTSSGLDAWIEEPGGLPRQIERIVPSGYAVHLEEPFAATTPTDVEQFVTDLADLANQVAVRDSRLIVTSTSRVFARVARPAFPGSIVEPSQSSEPLVPEGPDVGDRVAKIALWPVERLLAALVVDVLADADAGEEDGEALYDAVVDTEPNAGSGSGPNRYAVVAASRSEFVGRGVLRRFPLQFRDRATREAVRRHVQSSPEAAELSRRLVARAAVAAPLGVRLAALRALLRLPALWRQREWATAMLDAFLNSPDTLVRRQARFATVVSLPEMAPTLRQAVLDDARQHWNDRFLLRLALHGDLADAERAPLVTRLARSWDRWVRSVTAKNLHHLGADPAVLTLLLRDEDRQVAREAARSLLTHVDAWSDAAATPADLVPEELRRDPAIRPLLDKADPASC
jgi:hypothetical protein